MTTQYSPILKLALPVQGELSGTWGDVVNDNITSMVEQAIAGRAVINTWSTNSHTLTSANGTTSESRCAMLELTDTGTSLSAAGTVICPALSKIYIVKNAAGQNITVKTASGTGILVPDGRTTFLFCDGTNVVEAMTHTTSLQLGTSTTVTAVLDEDNMASNSATSLATQQSIKAYVDAQVGSFDSLAEVLAVGNTTGGTDLLVSTGDDITFADSSKAIFGAGSDLQIYHDGSQSRIVDTGTGNLKIQAQNFAVNNVADDENMITAEPDGFVKLFHNGSEKLATTSTGIDVTGTAVTDGLTVAAGGISQLSNVSRIGDNSTFADLTLNSSDSSQGTINFADASDSNIGRIQYNHTDNTMILRAADATRVTVSSTGIDVTGNLQTTGYLSVEGTSGNTGAGTDRWIGGDGTAGTWFYNVPTGSNHYFAVNNTNKLVVNSTGINVTGLTVDDGGKIQLTKNTTTSGDSLGIIEFHDEDGSATADAGKFQLQAFRGGDKDAPDFKLIGSDSTGVLRDRLLVEDNGDISFYEDTGTTAKLFWDSSAESLGIGTSSPDGALHVHTGTAGVVSASEQADELVLEGSAETGMTIISPDAQSARIRFTSPSTNTNVGGASIFYRQNINKMSMGTEVAGGLLALKSGAGVEALTLDSSGNVGIGTSSPTSAIDVRGEAVFGSGTDGVKLSYSASNSTGIIDTGFTSTGLEFRIANTERMRIDSSGNVGIGTSSPSANLHVSSSGDTVVRITSADGNGAFLDLGDASDPNGGRIVYDSGSNLAFSTASNERMRIDSSGKLLIGTTHNSLYNSSTQSHAGVLIDGANDNLQIAKWDGVPFFVNRMSTDGTIVALRKDGANVGSLGTASGSMYIEGNPATSKTGLTFFGASIEPRDAGAASNGVVDLGSSGSRFKDLHLSGAVNAGGSASFSADAINIELIETNVADENTRFRQNAGNLDIQTIDDASSNSKNRLRVDHSTGDISFYEDTGTTVKLFWDASFEALGIGTTSPNRKLTVQGPVGSLADFTSTTSTTGAGISFGDTNTSSNYVRIRAIGNEMQLFAGNSERVRIDADGNVGIGEDDPDSILHIQKTDSTAYSSTANDGQVGVGPTIYLENPANSNTTVGGQIVFGMRSTEEQVRIGATGGTAPSIVFGTGDAERMRIDSSGNVGIGFTNPSTRLFVSGGVNSTHATFSGQASRGLVIGTANTLSNDDGVIYNAQTAGSGKHIFQTAGEEAMRINASKKMLIGDSSSHTSDLLQIETPASGGGHGIQIRRNDSNADQSVGSITFGNNTATDIASISAKTDGATDNGALLFNTSVTGGANTERMRIDSSGNIGVGTGDPQELIHAASGSTSAAIRASGEGNNNKKVEIGYHATSGPYIKAGSSGVTKLQFYVDNTSLAGEFRSNGDFYSNDGTVHSLSDSRVKKDIADLTDGLDLVKQLRPRTFKFNGKSTTLDDNRTRYGFVADEVMAVASQYVSLDTQIIDDVEVDDFKSLSTTKMIPMLVKAIQELSAKNDALEARIATLENA